MISWRMVHSPSQRGYPPDQCPQQRCYLNMTSVSEVINHEHWLGKRLHDWFVPIIESTTDVQHVS